MYNLILPSRLQLPRNSTQWKLAGTETFRLASTKIFNTYGTNLQNPDKTICGIYKSDKGYSLIQTDQAGAEALIVAYLCRQGNFRNLFLNKIKSHVFVALHAFKWKWQELLPNISVNNLTSTPIENLKTTTGFKEVESLIKESDTWPASRRYYFIAKQICHSSNYDIKANALKMNVLKKSEGKIALSTKEAQDFLDLYHGLFPELREWHTSTLDALRDSRILRNLFGYPRQFDGVWNDELFKLAYAFVPQSTVGTITNIAFAKMQDHIEANKLEWDLLNNKHDSILLQAPDEEALLAAKTLKDFMEMELLSPHNEKFFMRSETAIGKNWKPYDKDHNPEGLRAVNI